MHKNNTGVYKENPELLEVRKYNFMKDFEDKIKELNLDHLSKEIFEEANKFWDVCVSYDFMPDNEKDVMKIINKVWNKYDKNI